MPRHLISDAHEWIDLSFQVICQLAEGMRVASTRTPSLKDEYFSKECNLYLLNISIYKQSFSSRIYTCVVYVWVEYQCHK